MGGMGGPCGEDDVGPIVFEECGCLMEDECFLEGGLCGERGREEDDGDGGVGEHGSHHVIDADTGGSVGGVDGAEEFHQEGNNVVFVDLGWSGVGEIGGLLGGLGEEVGDVGGGHLRRLLLGRLACVVVGHF